LATDGGGCGRARTNWTFFSPICIADEKRERNCVALEAGSSRPEIQCRGEGAPVVIPTRFTEDVRADARILAQEEAAFSAASFALASALAAVRAARSECHAAVIYCVNRPNGSASTFVSGL
jgi:hypothetical protein